MPYNGNDDDFYRSYDQTNSVTLGLRGADFLIESRPMSEYMIAYIFKLRSLDKSVNVSQIT